MATATISGAIYYKAPTVVGDSGTYAFFLFDATEAGWTHVEDHSFDFDSATADLAQYDAMQAALDSSYAAQAAVIDAAIAAIAP